MTKTYIVDNIDCANCAAKIERGINKIKGVESATLTFMTKKLVVEAPEEGYDAIYTEIDKIVHKVEKDAVIKETRR